MKRRGLCYTSLLQAQGFLPAFVLFAPAGAGWQAADSMCKVIVGKW